MSNFFLPRPLKAHALSAAVGSGKTRAAIAHMARHSQRNFLYVAPTIELGEQTTASLRKAIAEVPAPSVRNVHLVHSRVRTMEGKARHEALRSINEVQRDEGHIQVITTQTFLDVLASIKRPELWSVILDEAFAPATFDTFSLGEDAQDSWAFFREVFDVDAAQGHRIVPKDGRRSLVADLADGRLSRVGDKYAGLMKIAKAVCNPASRCELVVTPRVAALLKGEALPPTKKADGAKSVLEYASYIAPEYLAGFAEVLFLSALFEQTVLYHLWTRALGVTFEPHPDFPAEMLRDVHAEQGRFLAVGHLLHESDPSSKENLGRNVLTAAVGEVEEGQRVLDHIIRTASGYFGDAKFLLQVNKGTGYEEGKPLVPSNAMLIPAHAHGLNRYKDVDNVVALCVTNPNPQQLAWVKDRTGMGSREVTQAFRIHTAYQALGRCSIRKVVPTTDPKVVLVAGVDDARFIHGLFPGSMWLGQVGRLPCLKATADKVSSKTDGKAESLAKAIGEHLAGIDPTVRRVGSKTLKADLYRAMSTLDPKVQVAGCEWSARTWARAVGITCVPGSGWKREGQAVVRVSAADFGFAEEPSESIEAAA
jgi:hypothetical protein